MLRIRSKTFLLFFLFASVGFTCPPGTVLPVDTRGPSAELIRIRHLEPNGLGFSSGYTSLDFFLTVPNMKGRFLPFLDLRGHIFNNGKYASNLGIGCRYFHPPFNRIFGINLFYDYRLTSRKVYNQGSLGLEFLGESWDIRANGYLALGAKESAPYDFAYNLSSFVLTGNLQAPMSGVDVEAGFPFSPARRIDMYAAGGGYYYHSSNIHTSTIGASLRAQATFYDYVTLEAKGSYDHFFHWIGQIAASINVPIGYRKKPPSRPLTLQQAFFSPVQHNEIIVVGKKRITL